jgi:ABC-type antimicrobial peptide transport system permease subunit
MKYESAREAVFPTFYIPLFQRTPLDRDETRTSRLYPHDLLVRSSANAVSVAEQVRAALHKAEPDVPVAGIVTMRERVDRSLAQDETLTVVSIGFGMLALVLACVGLYGLMAYAVARRTREFGIRMALGAPPSSLLAMVLRESIRVVAIGLIVGMPIVLAGIRIAASQFYELAPRDSWSIGAAVAALALVAAVAALVPARRAAKADPVIALRYE